MLASGFVNNLAEYGSFNFLAYRRPVEGINCIRPTALAGDLMSGTNVDS
jgi:hypothetical protein